MATATPVYASGVAVDAAGNLVICDDTRVRVVAASTGTFYGQKMTGGHIYAIAGDGQYGDSGDGGPALQADISPASATLDAAGNVVLADGGGYIRVVAARTGTFYGQAMTAGDIYRVAAAAAPAARGTAAALQAAVLQPDRGGRGPRRRRLLRRRLPGLDDRAVSADERAWSAGADPGLVGGAEGRSAGWAGKDIDAANPLLDRPDSWQPGHLRVGDSR